MNEYNEQQRTKRAGEPASLPETEKQRHSNSTVTEQLNWNSQPNSKQPVGEWHQMANPGNHKQPKDLSTLKRGERYVIPSSSSVGYRVQ